MRDVNYGYLNGLFTMVTTTLKEMVKQKYENRAPMFHSNTIFAIFFDVTNWSRFIITCNNYLRWNTATSFRDFPSIANRASHKNLVRSYDSAKRVRQNLQICLKKYQELAAYDLLCYYCSKEYTTPPRSCMHSTISNFNISHIQSPTPCSKRKAYI